MRYPPNTEVPDGLADLPLEDRQRLVRECEQEIREGTVYRYQNLREEVCALDRG